MRPLFVDHMDVATCSWLAESLYTTTPDALLTPEEGGWKALIEIRTSHNG